MTEYLWPSANPRDIDDLADEDLTPGLDVGKLGEAALTLFAPDAGVTIPRPTVPAVVEMEQIDTLEGPGFAVTYDPATNQILKVEGEPEPDASAARVLDFMASCIPYLQAKLKEKLARRAHFNKLIKDNVTPEINRLENTIAYLEQFYLPRIEPAIEPFKESKKRSDTFGLARAGWRKEQDGKPYVVVTDRQKAIDYLSVWHPECLEINVDAVKAAGIALDAESGMELRDGEKGKDVPYVRAI